MPLSAPPWTASTLAGLQRTVLTNAGGGGMGLVHRMFVRNVPNIPYKNQDGPTCGIYALRNVMRYHFNLLASQGENPVNCIRLAPQLAARKRENDAKCGAADKVVGDSSHLWVPGGISLREVAKASALTSVGELLDGRYIAQIATRVGYNATFNVHLGNSYITALKQLVGRNVPPIVAFDVKDGGPSTTQGANSHWIMVIGWEKLTDAFHCLEVVYVMHWGQFYAFPLKDLQTSSQQLQSFPSGNLEKVYGTKKGAVCREGYWRWTGNPIDPKSLSVEPERSDYLQRSRRGLPTGIRQTDISASLQGAIIAVEPNRHPTNSFTPFLASALAAYEKDRHHWYRICSQESLHAQKMLASMVDVDAGLTELIDAVMYYTTPHAARNPWLQPGQKLKPKSTLCTLLKKAVQDWRALA